MIGESDCGFHAVALVEYPSRKKFVEIAQSAEVAAIGVHRAAGLESQWLIARHPGRALRWTAHCARRSSAAAASTTSTTRASSS